MNFPDKKGSYIIIYELRQQAEIDIGRLGAYEFPAGHYFYCGNARGSGGLKSRITRHLKLSDKKFWHIDFLKPHVEAQRIWFTTSPAISECDLVRILQQQEHLCHPVPRFGASDCVQKCVSHLLFFNESWDLETTFIELNLKLKGLIEEVIV